MNTDATALTPATTAPILLPVAAMFLAFATLAETP
jgi:hypothetical protein